MTYIKGFFMSMGMFTRIPLPFVIWDEKLLGAMVATFPLVGIVVGSAWWGAALLLSISSIPIMLAAAISTVIPFFVVGFIHLDGFMDTSDAHLSYRSLEDRVRILKDPNVGAFAVIMLVLLFILQFAAVYSILEGGRFFTLLVAICVVSRCLSAFSIFTLKHMPESNYAKMLGQNSTLGHKMFVAAIFASATAFSFVYAGFTGVIVILAVLLGFSLSMRVVCKSFKGISGDLLGYSLVIGEVCGLIALAAVQSMWELA